MDRLLVTFAGGHQGGWQVERIDAFIGSTLPTVERLAVVEGDGGAIRDRAAWALQGVISNERYATRREHEALAAVQPQLGRATATRAALIPLKKSRAWWEMPQDERRAIFEERSHHIEIGLEYLPAVSRRLHHGRDLGEPFDFLMWFEYAPEDAAAFEELVTRLRGLEEWNYVEREVDIRLTRDSV